MGHTQPFLFFAWPGENFHCCQHYPIYNMSWLKNYNIPNNVPRFHILFMEPLLCQNPGW